MKQSYTVVTLTMAFGIILIAIGPLGSVLAQTNTTANGAGNATGGGASGNATGGGASGNATGGGASGNATGGGASGNVTGGATTASEIENLTQDNPQALTNNTEVTDQATGLADLQKEQTSTDPNMTTPSG
ncbi:MAG: hypothetical protein ICV56_09605 [Nitrososphaeraceae archaeon]|nr:hypothetical protein [Nitrososphaeraceae archaeon]